ncbi:mannitol dehydrogenase family protein [Amorphoplanes nipponensis]|uniref:Mannitol-1-phosphate 5-dehydrogenase n=1 Tax=Actinoplanes nipponensis TaxID=135950 RepID=A0A919JC70_9ACTN|nr:mannitol dehydrogenase family protein [Actinoplanes nipponensis]GIE46907.1 mannitol-1-phosphate 5-dehydrogenase [Actinoplanes nipponensis]
MNALLSRSAGHGRAAPPVRLVHLGLGNFFRAHQCWYTDHAPDAADWGYAAFSGRGGGGLPTRLTAQDGLYTLVTRGAAGDTFEVVNSLARAHDADDHQAWLTYFGSPRLSVVTLTVTEAGYLRGPDGGLDAGRPEVQADLAALRADLSAVVRTAPARLVAGLVARRSAGAGPVALVPCDNVPGNGAIVDRVVRDMAHLLDPALTDWLDDSLTVVTTAVDRITPRPTPDESGRVRQATGFDDDCPVVTEPFREWVLSGRFPAGRPGWQDAGATFTDDVTPYERRKLWLLNGAHSLLAYAGSIRGHTSVSQAVGDATCRQWLEQWWQAASRQLDQREADLAAYRHALLDRFANPRMHHQLAQIGADGSQKLPIRILPVLRAERAAGRMPTGATLVLAAWICCLRGLGAPVSDVHAQSVVPLADGPLRDAARRVLHDLDPALGEDAEVVATVWQQCQELAGGATT